MEPTNRSHPIPLTEEIRLQISGYPDLPEFQVDLLSDGDSVYSCETAFEKFGTPLKTCLICTSCEMLLEIWAVVINLSPISSVRG